MEDAFYIEKSLIFSDKKKFRQDRLTSRTS